MKANAIKKNMGSFTLLAHFEIARGERVALTGRSGSGKTTLLRIIVGLESPDEGVITLEGKDITGLPPEKREIGVVFQDLALFPSMSVLENAAFGLKMRGIPREEREAIALEWLEKVELKSHARESVTKLSGGEKQRVAFVRALVWKPKCLLLDEPFSALDPALRSSVRKELMALHALWPVPLLLVTHDVQDVEAIASKRYEFWENPGSGMRELVSVRANP